MAASDTASDSYKHDLKGMEELEDKFKGFLDGMKEEACEMGRKTAENVGEHFAATIEEIQAMKEAQAKEEQFAERMKDKAKKVKDDIDTQFKESAQRLLEKATEAKTVVTQWEKENKISPKIAKNMLDHITDVTQHAYTKMKEFAKNACGMFAELLKGALEFILGAILAALVFAILLPLLVIIGLVLAGVVIVGLVFEIVGGVLLITAAAVTYAAKLLADAGRKALEFGAVVGLGVSSCVLKLMGY